MLMFLLAHFGTSIDYYHIRMEKVWKMITMLCDLSKIDTPMTHKRYHAFIGNNTETF